MTNLTILVVVLKAELIKFSKHIKKERFFEKLQHQENCESIIDQQLEFELAINGHFLSLSIFTSYKTQLLKVRQKSNKCHLILE